MSRIVADIFYDGIGHILNRSNFIGEIMIVCAPN